MRWRLILEQYISELIHIQSSKNIAADALNRLDIVDTYDAIKSNISSLAEHFSLEKEYFLHHLLTKELRYINKTINL